MSLNCVRSFFATGQQDKALALVRHALPILARSLGETAPNTVRAQQLLQALEAPGGYRLPPWRPADIFYSF